MLRRSILLLSVACLLMLTGCLPPPPVEWLPGPVVRVPSSIDATGASDVSVAFNAFVASVPDGSIIEFPAGGQYRMESTLFVNGHHDLRFDGKGALVFSTTPGGRERSNIQFTGGSNIIVRDLRVRGANPNAGALNDAAWVLSKEAQHGFDIQGVQGMTLTGVTVTDTYGDFVHITREYGREWANNVHITDSHFERNGRMGIAMVAARNVTIERNSFYDMRRATFDLEPPLPGGAWGVEHVTIRDNDIGRGRLFFVAAGGAGPVTDITISNNRLSGQALQLHVDGRGDGQTRRNWWVVNNTSDLPFSSPHLSVMRFWRTDNFVVVGNTQPFKGSAMYGARVENSCNFALDGNTYPNAAGQSLVVGECGS